MILLLSIACADPAPPASTEAPADLSCPESPNCVSSTVDPSDDQHYIDPLPGSGPETIEQLGTLIEDQKRTEIVGSGQDWLHATFKTAVFRFVDDVYLVWDETEGVVQVRSASRVGYGDMGVNRKRVERLRSALAAKSFPE